MLTSVSTLIMEVRLSILLMLAGFCVQRSQWLLVHGIVAGATHLACYFGECFHVNVCEDPSNFDCVPPIFHSNQRREVLYFRYFRRNKKSEPSSVWPESHWVSPLGVLEEESQGLVQHITPGRVWPAVSTVIIFNQQLLDYCCCPVQVFVITLLIWFSNLFQSKALQTAD